MQNEFKLTVYTPSSSVDVDIVVFPTEPLITTTGIVLLFEHLLTECHQEMEGLGNDTLMGRLYRIYPIDMEFIKERTAEIRSDYKQALRDLQWQTVGQHARLKGTDALIGNLEFFKIRQTLTNAGVSFSVVSRTLVD